MEDRGRHNWHFSFQSPSRSQEPERKTQKKVWAGCWRAILPVQILLTCPNKTETETETETLVSVSVSVSVSGRVANHRDYDCDQPASQPLPLDYLPPLARANALICQQCRLRSRPPPPVTPRSASVTAGTASARRPLSSTHTAKLNYLAVVCNENCH